MKRTTLIAVALFALAACGSPPDVSAPASVAIEVGKPFPGLVLPSLDDGRPSSIVKYRGKKTLLHVFASW